MLCPFSRLDRFICLKKKRVKDVRYYFRNIVKFHDVVVQDVEPQDVKRWHTHIIINVCLKGDSDPVLSLF